jgi:hypothetical protein
MPQLIHVNQALTVAPAASFVPTDVTGCILWLDASNAGSITEAGGAVSQWDDLSGVGNHATQGTGANQPTTGTRTQNGLNVIDFDGSNDSLACAVSASDRTQSVFAVVLADSNPPAQRAFVGATGNFGRDIDTRDARLTVERANVGILAQHGGATAAHSTPYIFSVILSATAAQLGQNATYESDSNSDTMGSVTTQIGRGAQASAWDGWIAEVLIYDNTISDGDRDTIYTYLSDKWGI